VDTEFRRKAEGDAGKEVTSFVYFVYFVPPAGRGKGRKEYTKETKRVSLIDIDEIIPPLRPPHEIYEYNEISLDPDQLSERQA
jgi:hypothetical protein